LTSGRVPEVTYRIQTEKPQPSSDCPVEASSEKKRKAERFDRTQPVWPSGCLFPPLNRSGYRPEWRYRRQFAPQRRRRRVDASRVCRRSRNDALDRPVPARHASNRAGLSSGVDVSRPTQLGGWCVLVRPGLPKESHNSAGAHPSWRYRFVGRQRPCRRIGAARPVCIAAGSCHRPPTQPRTCRRDDLRMKPEGPRHQPRPAVRRSAACRPRGPCRGRGERSG